MELNKIKEFEKLQHLWEFKMEQELTYAKIVEFIKKIVDAENNDVD
jgi:hypothetical protein